MTFEMWVQSRLTAHGYACGGIDGDIGPVTTAAIRAFQRSRGLAVTGMVDKTTENHLRMPPSTVMPEKLVGVPNRDVPDDLPDLQHNVWPRQKDVPQFFGAVGTNQTTIELPYTMTIAWDTSIKVRKMTLHSKVAVSALRVLNQVAEIYTEAERKSLGLDLFGGSLNVRRMRGGSNYSMHSWGIAIDFDPARNGLNTKAPRARLSHPDAIPFWEAWEAEGWLSLGRAKNFDWMHVQAARL